MLVDGASPVIGYDKCVEGLHTREGQRLTMKARNAAARLSDGGSCSGDRVSIRAEDGKPYLAGTIVGLPANEGCVLDERGDLAVKGRTTLSAGLYAVL